MNDVILGIVLGGVAAFIIVFVYWTCCAVAGRTDEKNEKDYKEHCRRDGAE